MRKTRILIITSMPWREDNNIGNSYSNLFGELDNIEIAHIYCRDGMPQNKIVHNYFQITEQSLVKNFKNRKYPTGITFHLDNPMDTPMENHSAAYNKMRILRWEIFFIIRDAIWKFGRWKTKELDNFVETFKPDLIFATLTYMPNVNDIITYLVDKYKLPLILYAWDDVYSLRQFSLSPLFWFRKWYQRKHIRKSVARCDFMYTITSEMQQEYHTYFGKECKMLYKGYDFCGNAPIKTTLNNPIKLVFMGNIGAGRWKALATLVEQLKNINSNKLIATLDIYTLSPRTKEMVDKLQIEGISQLKEVVPCEQVLKVQKEADILVHVEPYNKKDVSFYRLSFSTKLVDYFYNARCIIALGGKTASMSYLEKNDCGIVFYDVKSLQQSLFNLLTDKRKIIEYGKKAWEIGVKNHQKKDIQKELSDTFAKYSHKNLSDQEEC